MNKTLRFALPGLVLILILVGAQAASAHPLGNFSINHYAGLSVSRESITIDYILDMAEIPAFQEISILDANRNGRADADETTGYPAEQCEAIRPDLELHLAGRSTSLETFSTGVEFPPGQGGLPTLRLTCSFRAALPGGPGELLVEFEDHAFADRAGWREIVVVGDGVTLRGDFSSTGLSNRLSAYPQDLLSSPLDQRRVAFRLAPAPAPGGTLPGGTLPGGTLPGGTLAGGPAGAPAQVNRNDAFTQLILLESITFPTLLLALFAAFVWGAMHALTPGHGKTIVGAYLVGSRGTAKHALWLGLATTITHTAGVFALGLVTLFAAQYILPEQLFPWLSFLSGLLVAGIGINLFTSRLRAATRGPQTLPLKVVASSAVLAGDRHSHHYAGHRQGHAHVHKHHAHDDHGHGHVHHAHSHLPPGEDGSPVTWRSLLALGVSGGLIPCPSALVVLLSAIALDRIGLGLLLVLAFSLGLAGVLTGIGVVFVYAGRFLEKFSTRIPSQGRLVRVLPAFSASFIALAGLGIALRALMDMGIIRL